MIKLDYIFIDLDGPILDGKQKQYHCYKDILVHDGGEPLDIETYWNMKRNKSKLNVILERSKYRGTDNQFMDQWLKNIEEEYYLSFDTLKPKVFDTLNEWRDYSNNITLVTKRNSRGNLLKQLINLNIIDLFDFVISCGSEDKKYNALKHLKYERAIFIGDTEEDIIAANMLKIPSIGITNGIREKVYLNADAYALEIKDINMRNIGI